MALTQRQVDRARFDTNGTDFQTLNEPGGLTLRIMPTGNHSWVWRYYLGGRDQYLTFGYAKTMTLEEARVRVLSFQGDKLAGIDPRNPFLDSVTVRQLAAKLRTDHYPDVRLATRRAFEAHLANDIIPAWGPKMARELTPNDVRTLHRSMADRPSYANRLLLVITLLFNKAREWGYVIPHDNPTRYVKPYPSTPRQRYLSEEELIRLLKVLREWPERNVANLFRMLVYTGARRNEIAALEWEWIETLFGYINYPEKARKTGAMTLFLNTQAQDILLEQWEFSGHNSPYVFPSVYGQDKPRTGLWKVWQKIIKKAGIENLRIHDLRHTYASVGVGLGGSLPLVGGLLGHSSAGMTERYAHLDPKPLKELTEQIGQHLRRLETEA